MGRLILCGLFDNEALWLYNITMVTGVIDHTVLIEGHLTNFSKKRDRWCVLLSNEASRVLGKKTKYEIQFKPIGSIPTVRILRTT